MSSLAHEIRSPLTFQDYNIQSLLVSDSLKPITISEYLIPLLHSNQILQSVINDISDYVDFETNSFELSLSTLNLEQILKECQEVFQFQTIEKRINLTLSKCQFTLNDISFSKDALLDQNSLINNNSFIISHDDKRIKQVLFNLLANSIKFSNSGGDINISYGYISDLYIKISVTDNGCGIPESNQKKIMQQFDKIDEFDFINFNEHEEEDHINQDKSEYQTRGAGFGLTISQKIASGLSLGKYNIEIQSEENQGSTFSFYLAIVPPKTKSIYYQKINEFGNSYFKWRTLKETLNASQRESIGYQKNQLRNNQETERMKDLDSSENIGGKEYDLINQIPNSKLLRRSAIFPTSSEKEKNITQCSCIQIILADDETFNMRNVQSLIQRSGYQRMILQVENGQQLIDQVKEKYHSNSCCREFDLIITDVDMPKKNGYQAIKEIRQFFQDMGVELKTKMVVLTGYLNPQQQNQMLSKYQLFRMMQKPASFKEITSILQQLDLVNVQ